MKKFIRASTFKIDGNSQIEPKEDILINTNFILKIQEKNELKSPYVQIYLADGRDTVLKAIGSLEEIEKLIKET